MRLTRKELKRQLQYDNINGLFIRKISNSNFVKIGSIAGTKTEAGYINITVNNKIYLAHRLAWLYEHGYLPENDIDHKDRIKHHNWITNLREVSRTCNSRNIGNIKTNTSGVKGVSWFPDTKKWKAYLFLANKQKSLGHYNNFDNAVCARLAGEQCLNWSECDSNSPAFKYVKENIQH